MSVYDMAIWYLWAVPFLTVAALIALAAYASLKWSPLPKPLRGFELAKPRLEQLLKQGLETGSLTIRHKKSSKAIEFRKYIRAKGDYGVALNFPDSPGSRDAFESLKAHCEDNGILYRIEPAEDGRTAQVLSVDCELDLDKALNLATTIWTKIFRLTVQATCAVKLRDCDVWCDLVDSPNHDLTTSFREFNRRERQAGRPTIQGALLVGVLVLMFLTALFWLPIATLVSLGKPSDWSVAMGGMTASGSTGSLVFAALFLVSYAAMQFEGKPDRAGTKLWIGRSKWTRTTHALVHLGLLALMASVVAVWLGP